MRQQKELATPPSPQAITPPPAPVPTISIGQTKAQVIAAFGEPQRKAEAGTKEIFYYSDSKMKVTFINGIVSSID
jgi:outer membrane protein assembly factor BamE (lipoprotein component of BamABCDE complex)